MMIIQAFRRTEFCLEHGLDTALTPPMVTRSSAPIDVRGLGSEIISTYAVAIMTNNKCSNENIFIYFIESVML